MKRFISAFGFLTTLPMPVIEMVRGDLGGAAVWFPFVGAVLGALLYGVYYAAHTVLPLPVCVALTLAAWAWLTGGLHLDGVADCGDGFFAAVSRERRLEIMRDPRMGAFGGIALFLFLILKATALAEARGTLRGLNEAIWIGPVFPLLFAPIVARYMLLIAAKQPSARPGGLGDEFARHFGAGTFVVGAIVPVGVALLDPCPLRAVCAIVAALLTTGTVIFKARSKLGGMTGDVLGLSVELSELAVLLVYSSTAFVKQ